MDNRKRFFISSTFPPFWRKVRASALGGRRQLTQMLFIDIHFPSLSLLLESPSIVRARRHNSILGGPLITERMCRSFANEELINHDCKGRAYGRFWKGYLFICGQLWPLRSRGRTLDGSVGDSYAALAINISMNGWGDRLGCYLLSNVLSRDVKPFNNVRTST